MLVTPMKHRDHGKRVIWKTNLVSSPGTLVVTITRASDPLRGMVLKFAASGLSAATEQHSGSRGHASRPVHEADIQRRAGSRLTTPSCLFAARLGGGMRALKRCSATSPILIFNGDLMKLTLAPLPSKVHE